VNPKERVLRCFYRAPCNQLRVVPGSGPSVGRVGLGRVGSAFSKTLVGRVGSGPKNFMKFGSGRVGSNVLWVGSGRVMKNGPTNNSESTGNTFVILFKY
jgi:hypothetical protein